MHHTHVLFVSFLAWVAQTTTTTTTLALTSSPPRRSRRGWFHQTAAAVVLVGTTAVPVSTTAHAAVDCFQDCIQNCRLIAPKDTAYCELNCRDYCNQPDRTDGLSGSVSSSSGEVGILGGTFGQGTVVKGEDKPPSVSIPGLDFTGEAGRKLLGYQ